MKKKMNIIIAIIAISFLQGLQLSISPVLRQIAEHFPEVDDSLIQMLITIPALVAMVIALISGWMVTKISKKKLLLFAALISGVSGFLPFIADNFNLLLFSRAFYGVGLGLAMTMNTAVVAEFFEGPERVTAMGIQAASVGSGMVVSTTLGGVLGSFGFEKAYLLHIIGFIAFVILLVCLPDTGKTVPTKTEKVRLNKRVYLVSVVGFLEWIFLITFNTNIAMHISGSLAGNTSVSGILTGIFSGSQIVMGLILGAITKKTKNFTLPVAMVSLCVGCGILVIFPSNLIMLMIAALFCGFSQGMFVPTGMVMVSNAVPQVATAMAAAVFSCVMNFGQFLSPILLNNASKAIFGEVTTSNVYLLSTVGISIAALYAFYLSATDEEGRKQYENN
ncbi:MAG: MFS transporter [Blautia sp.]|nr:MFS transporter [Blautia sp.]